MRYHRGMAKYYKNIANVYPDDCKGKDENAAYLGEDVSAPTCSTLNHELERLMECSKLPDTTSIEARRACVGEQKILNF